MRRMLPRLVGRLLQKSKAHSCYNGVYGKHPLQKEREREERFFSFLSGSGKSIVNGTSVFEAEWCSWSQNWASAGVCKLIY
mmetsp:Transcript_4430/g.9828  ORF Transcript_4430/g.9828 Transcript_4430/m.9828 type:complete len:81 (-) Transcript_4430:153-395(-)